MGWLTPDLSFKSEDWGLRAQGGHWDGMANELKKDRTQSTLISIFTRGKKLTCWVPVLECQRAPWTPASDSCVVWTGAQPGSLHRSRRIHTPPAVRELQSGLHSSAPRSAETNNKAKTDTDENTMTNKAKEEPQAEWADYAKWENIKTEKINTYSINRDKQSEREPLTAIVQYHISYALLDLQDIHGKNVQCHSTL